MRSAACDSHTPLACATHPASHSPWDRPSTAFKFALTKYVYRKHDLVVFKEGRKQSSLMDELDAIFEGSSGYHLRVPDGDSIDSSLAGEAKDLITGQPADAPLGINFYMQARPSHPS